MNLAQVAARNAVRNRFRTFLTVLGVAVTVVAFVLLRTALSALNAGVDYAAKDRLVTRNKVSIILTLPKHYIETVRNVPGVKSACYTNFFAAKDPKDPTYNFTSLATEAACLDVFDDDFVFDPAQKQAWLADRKGVILGDLLATRLGVKVGDKVTLQGTIYPGTWEFNVSAIYGVTRRSNDRMQLFLHWEYLNESLPVEQRDAIGWIVMRVSDPSRGAAISEEIDRIFDEKDVQTTTMSERSLKLSTLAIFSALLSTLNVVSVIILAIMTLILGNTIAMGVRERTREYGVLRAVGFEPRHVALFIVGEAVTLGALASVLGLALSYPLVELGLGRFLEDNAAAVFPSFRIGTGTMAFAVVLSIALSVTASLLPAYKASKLSITDALRRVV